MHAGRLARDGALAAEIGKRQDWQLEPGGAGSDGTRRARLNLRTDQTPDAFGRSRLGGIGHFVAGRIEEESGIETRVTALGHGQRGGTPTARDRVLSSRFGVRAVELLAEGKLGHRVSLQGDRIVDLPLAEATKKLKMVDDEW